MKKLILLPFTAVFLFSCGPSEEELANEKKKFQQSVDSLHAVYEVQVNDYCKCLETKTTDECKNLHAPASATLMKLYDMADIAHKYVKVVSEISTIRAKTAAIMDKGAYCAKDAIANTVMRSDGTTYRAKSVATDDITPAVENSTKTATPSSDNNSKTTSTQKSKEKTKPVEEEHHHDEPEKKSDNPY